MLPRTWLGESNLGPVHTDPGKFENASFFPRLGHLSTLKRHFWSPKTGLLKNALQSGLI